MTRRQKKWPCSQCLRLQNTHFALLEQTHTCYIQSQQHARHKNQYKPTVLWWLWWWWRQRRRSMKLPSDTFLRSSTPSTVAWFQNKQWWSKHPVNSRVLSMHKQRLWQWGRQLEERISNTSRDMYTSRPFSSTKDRPLPPRLDEDRRHLKDQLPCLMPTIRHKHWMPKKNTKNNNNKKLEGQLPDDPHAWPWHGPDLGRLRSRSHKTLYKKSSTIQCLKTWGQKPLTFSLGLQVTNVTCNGLWPWHFKVNWTQR